MLVGAQTEEVSPRFRDGDENLLSDLQGFESLAI